MKVFICRVAMLSLVLGSTLSLQAVTPPIVTGPAVSQVEWTTAVIGGEVTDTGGEAPAVYLHYALSGSAHTSSLPWGVQSGVFSNTLRFLKPASNYVCRLQAVNSGGTNWTAEAPFTLRLPHYVAPGGNSVSPYTNWTDAATNLFDALGVATQAGAAIVMGDGIYVITNPILITNALTILGHTGPGGAFIVPLTSPNSTPPIWLSNTWAVLDGLAITGCVNRLTYNIYGPLYLQGGTVRNTLIAQNINVSVGAGMIRDGLMENCVIVSNRSTHVNTGYGGGLRIAGGMVSNTLIAYNQATDGGGGVYMTGGALIRSIIRDNVKGSGNVNRHGGGVWMTAGLLANCLLYSNRITSLTGYGAGVAIEGGRMLNCTVADNLRTEGNPYSGIYQTGGAISNSIAFYNGAGYPATGMENVSQSGGTLAYSCSQPLISGSGNISDNPTFIDRSNLNYRLRFGSGAIDTGAALEWAEDLEGSPRPVNGDGFGGSEFDMGCYEAAAPGDVFACQFSGVPLVGTNSLTVAFTAGVIGPGTNDVEYHWDFNGDSIVDVVADNIATAFHHYAAPGFYSVQLLCRNATNGEATLVRENYVQVYSPVAYVSTSGGQIMPYDTWAKAAGGLQEAIDAVALGGTVFVSAGVYTVNTKMNVVKPLTITGVGGPTGVIFKSAGPTRLMDINHADAIVERLTFTGVNLPAHPNSGAVVLDAGLLRYCWITNNALGTYGGGLRINAGTAHDLFLWTNSANHQNTGWGGGVCLYGGVLSNSVIIGNRSWDAGGGVALLGNGRVANCVITNNWMYGFNLTGGRGGGGVVLSAGQIENCLIAFNRLTHASHTNGGGVCMTGGRMLHCTVTENTLAAGSSNAGLHMTGGAVTNSIFYFNGGVSPAVASENVFKSGGILTFSCMQPLIAGAGNIEDDPLFAHPATNDFHLDSDSPCIDAGFTLSNIVIDLDGSPRPIDGDRDGYKLHDLGAYESPRPPPNGMIVLIR